MRTASSSASARQEAISARAASRSRASSSRNYGVAGAGEAGDLRERPGIVEGEGGKHLAVHLHPGSPQARHEPAVRHPVGARGRVDAHDPERPEVALALLAVAVGVGEAALDGLAGLAIGLAAAPDVALRQLHRLLVTAARLRAALGAWHRAAPLYR